MTGPVFLILATIIYAVVHSLLASLGAKTWVRGRFGSTADRWYRLAYNLFAVISGLPILVLLYILPDRPIYQIPSPWVLLTALGQLVGIIIIVVGIYQTDPWHFIGLRQTIEPEKNTSSLMITNGLYSRVRHPLYTGGLLLIWLMPTMTLILLTLFILLTIYLIVGARLEEKRLIHEFGIDYQVYQQHVPMLLPFPRRNK
jgi:protein-S-isoprenylcysteine O-methyltransferase Ste14